MDEVQTTPRKRLIEGRSMRCPRCERLADILRYVPLGMIDKFADETSVVYRCPSCKWIFAPADRVVLQIMNGRGTDA